MKQYCPNEKKKLLEAEAQPTEAEQKVKPWIAQDSAKYVANL